MATNTESLFAEHLAGHDEADSADARAAEEVAFEALLGEHPERSEELKRLRDANQRLGEAMPRTLSEGSPTLHRPSDTAKRSPKSAFHAKEGATIGEFRLVRLLGRGGMGEVWEAEQGSLSRRVALKLMLPERVDERGLDFFAREARAGGRLAHPGIVSVFGAGRDDGAHWIAMELVEGACDLRRSMESLREETELTEGYYPQMAEFIAELADALEAAHSAGVIHRDLKPGNVLVTDDDRPKVSDFGLAKLTDEFSISHAGELLGTYYYMSPEQVATKRAGIDHRTDIFSLGVVLYEMLTLVRPFDGDTTEQVAHKILWVDATDPRTVRSRIPGELAVICGKAMEKDPDRRYQTMGELAADLRRHLSHEPIHAKAPTRTQRIRKWAKRNPVKSVSGSIAVAAFVAISVLASQLMEMYQRAEANAEMARGNADVAQKNQRRAQEAEAEAVEATGQAHANELRAIASAKAAEVNEQRAIRNAEAAEEERKKAEQRAVELQQVSDFQDRQLSGVDAAAMGQTIRERVIEQTRAANKRTGQGEGALDTGQAELEKQLAGTDFTGLALSVLDEEVFERALNELESFENQPLVQAQLLQSVASTLRALGLLERAHAPQEQALEIRRRELGDEHPETLASINAIGGLLQDQGKLAEAESPFREAVEVSRRTLGDDDPQTLTYINNLGLMLMYGGRFAEAEPLLLEAAEGMRRVLGDDHRETLSKISNVGILFYSQGKPLAAEPLLREALEGRRRVLGDDHAETSNSISNLGTLLLGEGRLTEAEPLLREAVQISRRTLGDEHPQTLIHIQNLASLLHEQGNYAEAGSLFRGILEISQRTLGDEHPDTLLLFNNLGTLLMDEGKLSEAEPLLREAIEISRRALGTKHPETLLLINNLGAVLMKQDSYAEAETLFRWAVDDARHTIGDEHPKTVNMLVNLGEALRRQGKYSEAEPHFREVMEARRRTIGDEHPLTLSAINNLGYLFYSQGNYAVAEPLYREALSGRRKALGEEHLATLISINNLGSLLREQGGYTEAETLYREAIEIGRRTLGDEHPVIKGIEERLEGLLAERKGEQPTPIEGTDN